MIIDETGQELAKAGLTDYQYIYRKLFKGYKAFIKVILFYSCNCMKKLRAELKEEIINDNMEMVKIDPNTMNELREMLIICPEEKKDDFTTMLIKKYSEIVFHDESKIKLLQEELKLLEYKRFQKLLEELK